MCRRCHARSGDANDGIDDQIEQDGPPEAFVREVCSRDRQGDCRMTAGSSRARARRNRPDPARPSDDRRGVLRQRTRQSRGWCRRRRLPRSLASCRRSVPARPPATTPSPPSPTGFSIRSAMPGRSARTPIPATSGRIAFINTCTPQEFTRRRVPAGSRGVGHRAERWPRRDGLAAVGGRSASPACRFVWQSRTQGGMWPFTVVVGNPLRQHPPEMPLVERNHPIETLAPSGPNESFAVRVGLRRAHRRLQHVQRHRPKRIVNGGREDAVAIVHDEPIGPVERQAVPKLLDRPLSRGMRGDDSSARSAVSRCRGGRRHRRAERWRSPPRRSRRRGRRRHGCEGTSPRTASTGHHAGERRRHVAANRSRRHRETELQPELRRDALLTPRAIGGRHVGDEPLEFGGNPRPTAWA